MKGGVILSAIISNLTSIITAVGSWVTSVVSTITATGNEILLFSVLMPFVGIGIGLLRRMLFVGRR